MFCLLLWWARIPPLTSNYCRQDSIHHAVYSRELYRKKNYSYIQTVQWERWAMKIMSDKINKLSSQDYNTIQTHVSIRLFIYCTCFHARHLVHSACLTLQFLHDLILIILFENGSAFARVDRRPLVLRVTHVSWSKYFRNRWN